ncbi:hypothetical protein EIN_054590 [Entamoeba invadens IP1]|uniref:hypothetical protein n=1 Tax=Entamoeba invadens IP1 TaxID=370355 RepID=UPI0002C3E427|nr:hypothetical protein EIN_054590 [Entamoeba invadens IP1]ELP93174.1 hypothetical protein EIN_054590 [Entamoeba invadens IP1]|eukprot:XP_004259945.1 hypothetical protein EIN_054590 [Entamoeba invadens IP1]
MPEKDKRLIQLRRNLHKLSKSLEDAKYDRSHATAPFKGLDKVEHYLTKITEVMSDNTVITQDFSPELIVEFLDCWDAILEHVIRMPQHKLIPNLYILMCQIVEIKQLQPMSLADFPAPDEVSPQIEKLLVFYYNNLSKTALYCLLALSSAEEVETAEKREKKSTSLAASPAKKRTFEFQTKVRPFAEDFYEEAARVFVLVSIKITSLYEKVLQTVRFVTAGKVLDKEEKEEILSEEMKENFPVFKKWESYEKFITGKNKQCLKYFTALSEFESSWLVHFEYRGRFEMQYMRCWIEHVTLFAKDDIKEFPGYKIFHNEILALTEFPSDMFSPSFVCAEAFGAFSLVDENVYTTVIEKKSKKTNFYDVDGMGDLLLVEHFMYTYFCNTNFEVPKFNSDLFVKIHTKILESDSYALTCLTLSTLYQALLCVSFEDRKALVNYVLSKNFFNKMFCHWNHYVRMFFCELLLYRSTMSPSWNRVKTNTLLPPEKKTYDAAKLSGSDMLKFDQNTLDCIKQNISNLKAAQKNPNLVADKKVIKYVQHGIKDYDAEMKDYTAWEKNNPLAPLYNMLEMTRLNRLDQNVM